MFSDESATQHSQRANTSLPRTTSRHVFQRPFFYDTWAIERRTPPLKGPAHTEYIDHPLNDQLKGEWRGGGVRVCSTLFARARGNGGNRAAVKTPRAAAAAFSPQNAERAWKEASKRQLISRVTTTSAECERLIYDCAAPPVKRIGNGSLCSEVMRAALDARKFFTPSRFHSNLRHHCAAPTPRVSKWRDNGGTDPFAQRRYSRRTFIRRLHLHGGVGKYSGSSPPRKLYTLPYVTNRMRSTTGDSASVTLRSFSHGTSANFIAYSRTQAANKARDAVTPRDRTAIVDTCAYRRLFPRIFLCATLYRTDQAET